MPTIVLHLRPKIFYEFESTSESNYAKLYNTYSIFLYDSLKILWHSQTILNLTKQILP